MGMINHAGQWDWSRLTCMLPDHILGHLASILPPPIDAGTDRIAWKWANKDLFSHFCT